MGNKSAKGSSKVWEHKITAEKTPYTGFKITAAGEIYKWEPDKMMYRRLKPLRQAQIPKVRLAISSDYAVRVSVAHLLMEAFMLNPDGYLGVQYKDGNPTNISVTNVIPHTCVSAQRLNGYVKTGYKHLVVGVMFNKRIMELFPNVKEAVKYANKEYSTSFNKEEVIAQLSDSRTSCEVNYKDDSIISIVKVSIVEPSNSVPHEVNEKGYTVLRRYCTECKCYLPAKSFTISARRMTKFVYGFKSICNCCLSMKK